MAAGRIVIPCMPALDRNGDPVEGALLYFYENETTTLKTVYADFGLTTPLSNPVVADSAGVFPAIFADQDELYSTAGFDPSLRTLPDSAYDFVQASIAIGDGLVVVSSFMQPALASTGPASVQSILGVPFGAIPFPGPYSTLAAADAAAVAADRYLWIWQAVTISTNTTLNSRVVVSDVVTVNGGSTLLFAGGLVYYDNDLGQKFAGSGTVSGLTYARPEWFGALRNDSNDDGPAINKAFTALTSGDASYTTPGTNTTFEFSKGIYRTKTPIVIQPTVYTVLTIKGAGQMIGGTTLNIDGTGTPIAIGVNIQATAADQLVEWEWSSINTVSVGGVSVLWRAGGPGANYFTSVVASRVTDALFQNAPITLQIYNVRQLNLTRVSAITVADGHVGWDVVADGAGRTAADIRLYSCEGQGNFGSGTRVFRARGINGGGVSGIHSYSFIGYRGQNTMEFQATSGGNISDIWFYAPQTDGTSGDNLGIPWVMTCDHVDSYISDVTIDGWYASGFTGGYGLRVNRTLGIIRGIRVINGRMANIRGKVISYIGTTGCMVMGLKMEDCGFSASPPTPYAIELASAPYTIIDNVIATQVGGGSYNFGVSTSGTGGNTYIGSVVGPWLVGKIEDNETGSNRTRMWQGASSAISTGLDTTVTCQINGPTILYGGAMAANRVLTINTANAFPGARFRVKMTATGGFSLSVNGLINLTTAGTNSAEFEFNGTAWFLIT